MLLVANPLGDLPETLIEATAVEDALRGRADVELEKLIGDDATMDRVTNALSTTRFDVFHYAGHAEFDAAHPERSGLLLANRTLFVASSFDRLRVPRFVYLSACESGRLRGEPAPEAPLSLAESFLRRGVTTMLGTFFAVVDGPAQRFASTVYRLVASGSTLGDAVRDARDRLIQETSADWGNFMLYGDDTTIV